MAITGAGTGLTYKPGANKSGTDSFTYTIADGHGGTATATVSVTITPINDAPNAVNDGAPTVISIPAGGPVSIPVLANDTDPDADVLTITPTMTNGAKGTVAITGGGTGLTYDPAALATGTDTFTYTVRDAGGLTDTATVLVSLLPDVAPPVLSGLTERFPAHTMGTSSVLVRLAWAGADPGSGVASYQLQVSANGGAYANVPLASPTATTVDRTLALTTNAEYRFRIRATDAAGNTSAYRSWPVLKPVRFQEGTSLATYTGSWATATSANMSGGAGKFSSASNRRATAHVHRTRRRLGRQSIHHERSCRRLCGRREGRHREPRRRRDAVSAARVRQQLPGGVGCPHDGDPPTRRRPRGHRRLRHPPIRRSRPASPLAGPPPLRRSVAPATLRAP